MNTARTPRQARFYALALRTRDEIGRLHAEQGDAFWATQEYRDLCAERRAALILSGDLKRGA